MASVAHAWDMGAQQPERHAAPRREFVAVPGAGRRTQTLSPVANFAFRLVITAVIALAAICLCRIAFTSATTSTLISSKSLTSQISQARSTGDDLEVEQALLADPTRIKQLATDSLGMVPACSIAYVGITGSVLSTDNLGDCSLAGSIAAIDSQSISADLVADTSDAGVSE